ncbi:MAG TPA: hypothetical protein VGK73_13125 [Polyangiaceae bacterium]
MSTAERRRIRNQITVNLGEGHVGIRRHEALEKKAEEVGLPLSVWIRQTVLAAVGVNDALPSRREFEELKERLEALERWRTVHECTERVSA